MADAGPSEAERQGQLRWGTAAGRGALLATVLGSSLTFLSATSINIALPALARDLDVGVAALQWTVNAYTLTLAALVLLGGSLGDRFGRRRMFIVGTVWLTVTSLLCGIAPDSNTLIVARALQGIGGALLTPASLAILQSSFVPEDRSRAVGAWSGLAGVATAIGPLVGGWMVELWSWRLIFLVNLPLAVVVLVAAVRYLPETRDPGPAPRLDHLGAALAAVGLGAITATLTALGGGGLSPPMFLVGLLGVAAIAGFVVVERRSSHPMVPPAIFRSRQFTGANLVTLVVYGVLGGAFFVLTLQLQVVLGYSAVGAGAAELPITVLMLLLSARAGALAERIGPRLPMTVGPVIVAAGLLLLSGVDADSTYWTGVLPGMCVLGLGLSATVAPLTATVLAAVDPKLVGVASGVNNAVARAAGLLTVAA
ncbi:MAG TPA: MFS transporter, partial [Nocardioidaceae bacterium]|nr:MFS transporter [Nocardioidaceae bacterium]